MSDTGQPPQQSVAFLPFTGKLTRAQGVILRTLWDIHAGQSCTSHLRHGLHSSAASLVRKGWVWKREGALGGLCRPLYGINKAGIPAALEAWKEVYPDLAAAAIEARLQQQLSSGVRSIIGEELASGDLPTASKRLHQASGGKTVQQVAGEWAGPDAADARAAQVPARPHRATGSGHEAEGPGPSLSRPR